MEDKKIAERLDLSDRINVTDQKGSVRHTQRSQKPICRIIKQCKPGLGKVSKQIVENINRNVRA